ncbi:Protein of unknown function [Cotesia congregata]|uniref:Uncharacterized protein n=1 Tax=Cotesia congregata TaxID=51543 RepID=A0A8J2HIS5_COTCN|nr:Protein of unknown function [Cotesia congregata]
MTEFVINHQIDIALISETKLHSKHRLSFNDHRLIGTNIPNAKNGGGTAILINKKFDFTPITYPNSLTNKVIEYTAIKLNVKNKKTFLIFSIYAAYSKTNNHGILLNRWEEKNNITHKTTLHNPKRPTYPSAGSYLDHCLADTRIQLKDLRPNRKLVN